MDRQQRNLNLNKLCLQTNLANLIDCLPGELPIIIPDFKSDTLIRTD